MVYNVEKTLKEHRDKISDADAKTIETSIDEVKRSINDGDADKLNAATDRLTQASHKLAEAMYKATSGAPARRRVPVRSRAAAALPSGGKPKEDVVDAEFVDVDDKKIKPGTGRAVRPSLFLPMPASPKHDYYETPGCSQKCLRGRCPEGVSETCPKVSSRYQLR